MDINEIKQQVARVVEYSQDIPNPQVDTLIDNWFEAKRDIIEAFGGEPIYEMPYDMTFTLTEDEKDKKISSFLSFLKYESNNPDLQDFFDKNRAGFFDNKVVQEYEYNGQVIPVGMKLTRSIKFFEKSKYILESLQNKASQYIQENKVTGRLCFSVHPLDYLSSSENTYNWHSCHALDGEYRAGNLSYMQDKATIVCYIKGVEEAKLPNFPEDVKWNSKKWRMLVFLSDNWHLIFAGRQYPFNSTWAMDAVRINLLEALKLPFNAYCDWTDPYINYVKDSHDHEYGLKHGQHVWIRGNIRPLVEVVIDYIEDPLHYNDVLRSNMYQAHYTTINNFAWYSENTKWNNDVIHVGSPCLCLRCGQYGITNPEAMMCEDCDWEFGRYDPEIYAICSCCNRRVYRDDTWTVGDDDVCDDCINEHCFTCADCEEVYYLEDENFVEELDQSLCPYCYKEYLKEKEKIQD